MGVCSVAYFLQLFQELWTDTYLNHLSERLATNIYNALCVEILDQLSQKLTTAFTVELMQNPNKDDLLKEKPAIESKRKELVSQIAEFNRALSVLGL